MMRVEHHCWSGHICLFHFNQTRMSTSVVYPWQKKTCAGFYQEKTTQVQKFFPIGSVYGISTYIWLIFMVKGRYMPDVSENSGFSPQIIHFNRVFHHYFHHPFWDTPTIWKTPI